MRIALFGATGRTGSRVLRRLLARGDTVRALARDPARLLAHAGLAAIAGHARDAAAVAHTMHDTDAVVVCLGMDDITQPGTAFSDAVKTIVAAAEAAGVRRLVAIASAGALPHEGGGLRSEHGAGAGPYANVAAEHARNYRTLAASRLDWTLMCPLDLVDDLPEGRARWAYEALPAGSGQTGYDDLATTIVALLGDASSHRQRVGIVSLR